jgi:deoxyribodipyrimidine photolyase-related protein
MINSGLLSPQNVIDRAQEYGRENDIRINSVEGFIRQVIGWREFIRGMYEAKGGFMRTKNFWGFRRHMPKQFYDGTTGIDPIDDTIKKTLKSGYNHHIERLMVLGNFMLLCEIKPDHVYQWFMEMYIDAYDWVMVPNVYGMSQFADGGTFASKPYIGGSNYIKKMSNYSKADWCDTWDGLFWNFMDKHSDVLGENARLAMLLGSWEKMDKDKREKHLTNAEKFLNSLDPA